MSQIELEAERRTEHGKGASRRLRRAGKLPAVVYSKGVEPISVAIDPRAFTKAVTGTLRRNALISLKESDGNTHLVMTREIQIDSLRRHAKHVDFWRVSKEQDVEVRVPVELIGRSKAVVLGARIQVVLRTIKVSCKPDQIPEKVQVDTTELGRGAFRAKDVPMPGGVTLVETENTTIFTISQPRGEDEEDEAEGGAAGGEAGGETPAPAA
jgi:large subunit ribosomal protein L25